MKLFYLIGIIVLLISAIITFVFVDIIVSFIYLLGALNYSILLKLEFIEEKIKTRKK